MMPKDDIQKREAAARVVGKMQASLLLYTKEL